MRIRRFEQKGTDIICYLRYDSNDWIVEQQATAHLHKGDKYDEAKGRKIAYYKALEKLLLEVSSCLRRSAISLTKSEAKCWGEHTKYFNKYLKLKHKIEEGKIWK